MGYKAIIADDEKKIIGLIRQLGRWEELGIEIIDECHDGGQALASILEKKPDFVLSDIKMPVYDGIELIEKAREYESDTLFILLSGYRYFEYARSAIQLNVVDYLLKPIDEEQLNEILEKVCLRIDQKRMQEEDSRRLTEYRNVDTDRRLQRFWDVLLGRDREQAARILSRPALREEFSLCFRETCLQIVYVDTDLDGMLVTEDSIFRAKVAQFIDAGLGSLAEVICHISYLGHVILINFPEEKKAEIKNAVSALFYSIRDLNEVYGEFRINIGVSAIKTEPEALADAFQEAMISEWGRLIFFGNKILEYGQVNTLSRFDPEEVIGPEEQKVIGECLACLRSEELGGIFSGIYERAVHYNNANPADMMEVFGRLREVILRNLAEEDTRKRMEDDYYFAYQEARNFQQIFRNIYQMLSKYIANEQEKLKEKLGKPIEEAVRFIRQNYAKPISLEDAAQAANVSSAYLSRIFKEKTGSGFNEYLTELRLEESRKMLAESNLTIKEIAVRVGYADEKYYSKLFKKTVGIKPTDYRRLYG